MPLHTRTKIFYVKLNFVYLALGLTLALLALGAYRFGPESELTLFSRLHYNTLFVITPCMGKKQAYDDGNVTFNYTTPPSFFSNTASIFINTTHQADMNPFRNAIEVIDMNLPFLPSYKFRESQPKDISRPIGAREIRFKNAKVIIKADGPSTAKYGPEFIYFTANGYIYRISLPTYAERMTDRSWLYASLHHSGILSTILPGAFSNFPPPRGFFAWFFTPCADKQLHCSSSEILKSLEILD